MLKTFCKFIIIILLALVFVFVINELVIKVYLADFYFREALVWRMQNNWPETLKSYNKVLSILPRQHYYKYRFAQDLEKGLEFYSTDSSKIQILDLAIKQIENIPPEQRTIGMLAHQARMLGEKIHLEKGEDYSQVEKLYSELSSISSQMAGIYNDWCQIKIYQENWPEAEAMCQKALSLYPPLDHPLMNEEHRQLVINEQIKVYDKLGQIYQEQGNYEKAMKTWQKLLELSPFQYHIHKKIADIYYLQGDLDKAIFENLHGFTLNPEDSTWPFAIALLYEEKGDLVKARQFAEVALEISPSNKEIQQFLSRIESL